MSQMLVYYTFKPLKKAVNTAQAWFVVYQFFTWII